MQDIRLDFITNIRPSMLLEMTNLRQMYVSLDEQIKLYENLPYFTESGADRTLALARTNLEISLQFAIKTLCLIGEIK
jgi:hypothetical protein